MQETPHQHDAYGVARGADEDRGRQRPFHGADEERAAEPHSKRDGHRYEHRVSLRGEDVGRAVDPGRGVGRKACDRAVGDELRVVIESKKDVGRAGGDRECRHHGADQRADPFGDQRRRHDERGCHSHFHGEGEEKCVGRHMSRYRGHADSISATPRTSWRLGAPA